MKTMLIDAHTHILPGIDDGAKTPEEGAELLRMLASQSIDAVVATPHYFSLDMTPSVFSERVRDSWNKLNEAWNRKGYGELYTMPRVLFGAEIYLKQNMTLTEGLEQLRITGTDLVLLELPFVKYQSWIAPCISDLCSLLGVRPVLAHIERFLPLYSRKELELLMDIPDVLFQFNPDTFSDRGAMRFLIRLLKEDYPVLFGSDCHGMHHRPPELAAKLGEAQKKIDRKLGRDFFQQVLCAQQAEFGLA